MPQQLEATEVAYWMELEKLLARCHHDLRRLEAAAKAIDDQELADVLDAAATNVACGAYIAAVRTGLP